MCTATWIAARRHLDPTPTPAATRPAADAPQALLDHLEVLVQASMRASRPVLLGSRDPRGPSCVSIVKAGDLHGERPASMGDVNGGPGTTMATIYTFDRQSLT